MTADKGLLAPRGKQWLTAFRVSTASLVASLTGTLCISLLQDSCCFISLCEPAMDEFERSLTTPTGPNLLDGVVSMMWKVGTVAAGLVSVVAALLFWKQDNLLYFPEIGGIPRKPGSNPRRYRSPAEHQIPFESHRIMCEDGVSIHSWLLLHPSSRNERVPTIMFFHGNAGNIGLRLPNAIQMYQYLRANIMLVEYRGYGDSDDVTPSERGLKLDSEAALRFLSTYETVDPDRIFVFGRSLGGAVSFHLAQYAQQNGLPLAGVIVENTFLSISAMVDHLMPYIAPLKGLVLRIGWNSYRIAPRIQIPILYLSGGADQLVPPKHMRELYNMSLKSSRCARILIIKDGTHNETWLQGGREYWDKFRSFMAEAISGERRDSFRSTSAMEDVAVEDDKLPPFSASLGVGMGADTESSTASAIPTMPSNLVGMAREASQKSTSSKRTDSDVKKQI